MHGDSPPRPLILDVDPRLAARVALALCAAARRDTENADDLAALAERFVVHSELGGIGGALLQRAESSL